MKLELHFGVIAGVEFFLFQMLIQHYAPHLATDRLTPLLLKQPLFYSLPIHLQLTSISPREY